jgi:hypothetical protein
MFGYVRPLKPELRVRELSRYRSVYCGICKQIGHDYGQLPRLSVGYDLTFLAVLLLSFSDDQPVTAMEGCVLNPAVRKPVVRGGPVLELCAGLSVLLASRKAADDIRDSRSLRGFAAAGAFRLAERAAKKKYPEYSQIIASTMSELAQRETGAPDIAAAGIFGRMLQDIFEHAAALTLRDDAIRKAVGLLGRDIGEWIYLADAIDDWADDCNNGNWNPFSMYDAGTAREIAASALRERELTADRTAALLPYGQDSGLIENIITKGLPSMSGQVLRGEKPPRL